MVSSASSQMRERTCSTYRLRIRFAGVGGVSGSQQAAASAKKDEPDDIVGDLNRSTNRLRRKFDPTDNWQGTRLEVERVLVNYSKESSDEIPNIGRVPCDCMADRGLRECEGLARSAA